MSLMLLITMYCCSVHVFFFLHSALLRWGKSVQWSWSWLWTSVDVCDKKKKKKPSNWMIQISEKCPVAWEMWDGVATMKQFYPQGHSAVLVQHSQCLHTHPKIPTKRLSAYMKEAQIMEQALFRSCFSCYCGDCECVQTGICNAINILRKKL